jgi:hypothetical protein
MKNNARRKHVGYQYDRAGRIIDGLIDNGRLILMIVFCLAVGFMMRSFPDTAGQETGPSSIVAEAVESERPAAPGTMAQETDGRIQERSDYRVEMYAKCADKSYEDQNKSKCERLYEQTDDTLEDSLENEIKNKSWNPDEGTNYESDSQPITLAIRTT